MARYEGVWQVYLKAHLAFAAVHYGERATLRVSARWAGVMDRMDVVDTASLRVRGAKFKV